MRVCLDTNVLIAAFATRGLCTDVLRTVLAEHELVVGEVILTEFRKVLTRKFKVPPERLDAALAVFDGIVVVPKPKKASSIRIRDAADRWILATAIDGDAEVLVTGDEDLLSIADESPVHILTPRGFWELLRAAG